MTAPITQAASAAQTMTEQHRGVRALYQMPVDEAGSQRTEFGRAWGGALARRIDLSHVIEQRYKPERRRPAVTQGRALVRFLTSPGARWVLGGDFVEVDFFFGESRLHPSAGKFDQAFPNIRLFSFFGQVETLTRICVVLLRRLNHGHTQP
jgi:hypothetical protein